MRGGRGTLGGGRRAIVIAVVAAFVLAACGTVTPTVVPSGASSVPVASPASPASSPSLPVSTSASPAVTVGPGQTTVLDPSLLEVLPTSVGGAIVTEEPASFAEAIKDPSFVANVDRAAFAVVVDGGDLAAGVVAHLRAGSMTDKTFADWRASYDDGACAQSAGIAGHAESTMGGRTVYVTTCGGGLRVYHAYVPTRGVVVSVVSGGARLFGDQLMAAIHG